MRTLIAKKNNNSFLLAPSKEGVTYHLQLFNRRQCAVDEEIEIVRKDISHYQSPDRFLISVKSGLLLASASLLMYFDYLDLRNPEIIMSNLCPRRGFATESELFLVRSSGEYSEVAKDVLVLSLKLLKKSIPQSRANALNASITNTFPVTQKQIRSALQGLYADEKCYYLMGKNMLSAHNKKTGVQLSEFKSTLQLEAISGRGGLVLYVSTTHSLYALRHSNLQIMTVKDIPSYLKEGLVMSTIVFRGVEFVVLIGKTNWHVTVLANINLKIRVILQSDEIIPNLAPIPKGNYFFNHFLDAERGEILLQGYKGAKRLFRLFTKE